MWGRLSTPSQVGGVGSTGFSLVFIAPGPLLGFSGVAVQGCPKVSE